MSSRDCARALCCAGSGVAWGPVLVGSLKSCTEPRWLSEAARRAATPSRTSARSSGDSDMSSGAESVSGSVAAPVGGVSPAAARGGGAWAGAFSAEPWVAGDSGGAGGSVGAPAGVASGDSKVGAGADGFGAAPAASGARDAGRTWLCIVPSGAGIGFGWARSVSPVTGGSTDGVRARLGATEVPAAS